MSPLSPLAFLAISAASCASCIAAAVSVCRCFSAPSLAASAFSLAASLSSTLETAASICFSSLSSPLHAPSVSIAPSTKTGAFAVVQFSTPSASFPRTAMKTVPFSLKIPASTSRNNAILSSCTVLIKSRVSFFPLLYSTSSRKVSGERSILSASYRFIMKVRLTVRVSPAMKVCSSFGKSISFPIIEITFFSLLPKNPLL